MSKQTERKVAADDIGKLCWFWDGDCLKHIGILEEILDNDTRPYWSLNDGCYQKCHRLTPPEVAEITGYKVEEEE